MGFVLKKLLDMSICLFNQCGCCLHHDKKHSLREFHRQYRVCGEIGSGGFGRVYKAYRLADGLPVAVKSIRHKRVTGWTLAERRMIPTEICFMEECQDVQGIIRLIGWFKSRRGFLIVMERPANFMDLFDLISTFGWLEEGMARGLFSQIVDTVTELYKKHSVIHRDIKDENVVVDLDKGTAWLVDFGAAELLQRAKKQPFRGTMCYSPPEVFKRDCYYPLEGTVWSLGILLYLLVVGKPPFRNELQICTGKLTFPHSKVSSECRAIIRRCLCPSPEERINLDDLQQNDWVRNSAMDSFSSNFEAQWRRRKRHCSLNSNGHRSLSDDDEDCSYRTEAGTVPGPLTIPTLLNGSVVHRSTTASSFVEHNSQMEQQQDEGAVLNANEQQNATQELAAELRSSCSSLPMSEMGFETALEYDDWQFASFSSACSAAALSTNSDMRADKKCAFGQQSVDSDQQYYCPVGDRHISQPFDSVPPLCPHQRRRHFGLFRATKSDKGSARHSFASSSSCCCCCCSDARSISFISGDSFTSSTSTYFSASSYNNNLLPESTFITDGINSSNSSSKLGDDEEDETTLRTELPRIVLKEWSGKELSEDEEDDEWDETIRENIDFERKQQNKAIGRTDKALFGEEADQLLGEETELLGRYGLLGEEAELLERDGGEKAELLGRDGLLGKEAELLERDESSSSSESSCPSTAAAEDNDQQQRNNKANLRPKIGTLKRLRLVAADGFGGVRHRDGEQQQGCSTQSRKGGDRYRQRRAAQMLDGLGRKFDRRRRRLTSPPFFIRNQ